MKILEIPLSEDTVKSRFQKMSNYIEEQVIDTGNEKFEEDLLFSEELETIKLVKDRQSPKNYELLTDSMLRL